ncbi:hypothetical protein [Pedobacter sp. Hv1]|uniref:hypothetical protein n=1 Tax=Pedobacter sp. Hv1 TaxID=1740090 RepID=UPI000A7AA9D1|nr:hypothetical protein [Pedobacter sp. Hv1]
MKNLLKHVYSIGFMLLFISSIQKANAQDTTQVAKPIQSLNKIKLALLGIFYEREQLVSTSTTVYGGIGLGSGISYSYNNWAGSKWAFSMSPSAYVGFRNYYKLEQRAKKGRETRNNSTNFFGAEIGGSTKAIIEKNTRQKGGMGLAAFWGIQRSLGRKVNFELQLGPMLTTDFDEVKLQPISGRIGFSYIL